MILSNNYICKECKKQFKNKHSLANHLRYGCGGSDDINLVCPICKNSFTTYFSSLKQRQNNIHKEVYCSKKCAGIAHSKHMIGKNKGKKASEETKEKMRKNHADYSKENHPQWKNGPSKCIDCGKEIKYGAKRCLEHYKIYNNKILIFICPVCGKSFKSNNKNRKFCSRSCLAKERFKNPKNCPSYIDGRSKIQKYCLGCNKKITKGSKTGYCLSCVNKGERSYLWLGEKAQSRQILYCIDCGKEIGFGCIRCKSCARKLELNPRWLNGKSFEPYPLGWNKTFKEQIRYRDEYKCQVCGISECECRRKLDVHHIDYDKMNINQNNLISLCISCHIKTNSNRKYWIEYFKEKLYVAH